MSYVSDALSRITSQFEQSPKVLALLTAIVGPLDSLQATSDSVKTERWIDTAIGAQLDGCGYIVGETRQGRDDDAYRQAIKFRVFVNISEGTPSALINGLAYLVDSDDKQYLEVYPATSILFANGPNVPAVIQSNIQDLSPAAISDVPVMVSYTEKPFRFGTESIMSDLFVNDNYLDVNGSDLIVNIPNFALSIATLSGIVPAEITAGEMLIEVNGSILVVSSAIDNMFLDTGFHTTGVFQ